MTDSYGLMMNTGLVMTINGDLMNWKKLDENGIWSFLMRVSWEASSVDKNEDSRIILCEVCVRGDNWGR
jgi:hypothetical protein